jgi:hypothetical protein
MFFPISIVLSFLMFVENRVPLKNNIAFEEKICDTLKKCDSLSTRKILKLAHEGIANMNSINTLSIEQVLVLIKIYNTLHFDTVASKEIAFAKEFRQVFFKTFLPKVAQRLEIISSNGMTLYSSKYDIYIGESLMNRCNDFYVFWEYDSMNNYRLISD